MSLDGIRDFVQHATKDSDLCAQLAAIEASEGPGVDVVAAVIALGAGHGFDFTKAELMEAVAEMELRAKKDGGDELSDVELNKIAGGLSSDIARGALSSGSNLRFLSHRSDGPYTRD